MSASYQERTSSARSRDKIVRVELRALAVGSHGAGGSGRVRQVGVADPNAPRFG
jgi:hypothetical protein